MSSMTLCLDCLLRLPLYKSVTYLLTYLQLLAHKCNTSNELNIVGNGAISTRFAEHKTDDVSKCD